MRAALEHFTPHYKELRQRLIAVFIAIALASTLSYIYIDQIAGFCMQPLFQAYPDLGRLVYTKLTEAFVSYIKLSILVGIGVSFPFLLYQIWMFIAPGLLEHEQRLARQIVGWASLLFAGGAAFAFFIVLPRMLTFFMGYAGDNLQPMPKLGLYLTFVARTVLAFGIAFEIPFLMVMAMKTGLVSRTYFTGKRTWFYMAIVVLSFLLTAGDITATALLSLPLFALYEAGIIIGRVFASPSHQKKL